MTRIDSLYYDKVIMRNIISYIPRTQRLKTRLIFVFPDIVSSMDDQFLEELFDYGFIAKRMSNQKKYALNDPFLARLHLFDDFYVDEKLEEVIFKNSHESILYLHQFIRDPNEFVWAKQEDYIYNNYPQKVSISKEWKDKKFWNSARLIRKIYKHNRDIFDEEFKKACRDDLQFLLRRKKNTLVYYLIYPEEFKNYKIVDPFLGLNISEMTKQDHPDILELFRRMLERHKKINLQNNVLHKLEKYLRTFEHMDFYKHWSKYQVIPEEILNLTTLDYCRENNIPVSFKKKYGRYFRYKYGYNEEFENIYLDHRERIFCEVFKLEHYHNMSLEDRKKIMKRRQNDVKYNNNMSAYIYLLGNPMTGHDIKRCHKMSLGACPQKNLNTVRRNLFLYNKEPDNIEGYLRQEQKDGDIGIDTVVHLIHRGVQISKDILWKHQLYETYLKTYGPKDDLKMNVYNKNDIINYITEKDQWDFPRTDAEDVFMRNIRIINE